MEIEKFQIVTEIENVHEDSADIIVTFKDGYNYVIEVATPQYLLSLMVEKNTNFIEPGENYIIVKKLTPEIIQETLEAFAKEKNAHWLKLLHISSYFDIETLNNVRDEVIREYYINPEDYLRD